MFEQFEQKVFQEHLSVAILPKRKRSCVISMTTVHIKLSHWNSVNMVR